jgi:hypothetical protein
MAGAIALRERVDGAAHGAASITLWARGGENWDMPFRIFRLFRVRTVPGRIRTLAAIVLLAFTALVVVAGTAMRDAQEAVRAIGHDEGPTVVATSDVYLALSDMDAQVTNVLLTGQEDGWLCDPEQVDQSGSSCERAHPRHYYDIRREDAQRAALQAARLAENDPVRLRTVQSVLDGLHQYDQRVQTAMERGRDAEHSFGALPPDAAQEYRMATTIMTEDLLPKAYNLTLDSAAAVDATYHDELSGVVSGRVGVLVAGLFAVAALAGLHVALTVPFRRLVSPFLAGAVAGTAALTVAGAALLATEAEYLRTAKEGGFDPVLTLSRTQAIGKGLDADRTRFLLASSGFEADRFDQTYLEKSQTILYISTAKNLAAYYAELDKWVQRYGNGNGNGAPAVEFGGFYGDEARRIAVHGQRESLETLLSRYVRFQHNDRRVRRLAVAGKIGEAARAHLDTGQSPDLSARPHASFRAHDEGLATRTSRHQYVVDRTIMNAERALRPWPWLLPGSFLAIAALVVAGVWPRLAEFR